MHLIDRRKGILLGMLPSRKGALKATAIKEVIANNARRHQYDCFRFRQILHLSYN